MRAKLRSLGPIVFAMAVVSIALVCGTVRPLENAFMDARSGWFDREPANDAVVVEIDARTLHALDRWPWSRSIHAELIRRLNQILAQHTGQPLKRIQDDTERDYIMSADQGKEYGIIDDVIRKRG